VDEPGEGVGDVESGGGEVAVVVRLLADEAEASDGLRIEIGSGILRGRISAGAGELEGLVRTVVFRGSASEASGWSMEILLLDMGELGAVEGRDLMAMAEDVERFRLCELEVGMSEWSSSSGGMYWLSTRRRALLRASFSSWASRSSSWVSASFIRSVATILFASSNSA